MIAAGQVRQDGQWADGCGRRVVVRRSGELIVLDKGDFYALHVGGTSGLEISPAVPGDHQAST